MQRHRISSATAIKGVLTTLDSWLRSGVAAGPNARWLWWVLLGRVALAKKKSMQELSTAKGSVVGYAQRGRRVVAGSRLAREAVPSAGSTGWCLVESPDDESPSGPPRNEEGHGRCLSRFSVMVGLGVRENLGCGGGW